MHIIPTIVGPTASGKTKLAIKRALALGGEIISIDSRQIYKGFVIGTSQPTADELAQVPHHLVNMIDPDEKIDAARYVELVHQTMNDILGRDKVPVLCGGTGLYIRALRLGLTETEMSDPDVRAAIEARIADEGAEVLLAELTEIDPATAEGIHPNNIKRLTRALEIAQLTGQAPSLSRNWESGNVDSTPELPGVGPVEYELTGLDRPREQLYDRINTRIMAMLDQGWLTEVEQLLKTGVARSSHAMQGIGYRELAAVLAGESGLEEAIPLIQQRTRNYAKRQITWFRREPVEWLRPDGII